MAINELQNRCKRSRYPPTHPQREVLPMESKTIMEMQIIYYYLDLSFSNIVTIISKVRQQKNSNSLKQKPVNYSKVKRIVMPILALMSKQSAVSVWFKVNFF